MRTRIPSPIRSTTCETKFFPRSWLFLFVHICIPGKRFSAHVFSVRVFVEFEALNVLAFFLTCGLHGGCMQDLSECNDWNGMIDTA